MLWFEGTTTGALRQADATGKTLRRLKVSLLGYVHIVLVLPPAVSTPGARVRLGFPHLWARGAKHF